MNNDRFNHCIYVPGYKPVDVYYYPVNPFHYRRQFKEYVKLLKKFKVSYDVLQCVENDTGLHVYTDGRLYDGGFVSFYSDNVLLLNALNKVFRMYSCPDCKCVNNYEYARRNSISDGIKL